MLAPQAALGAVLSRCTLEEVRRAPYADVNLVLRGKGRELAPSHEGVLRHTVGGT